MHLAEQLRCLGRHVAQRLQSIEDPFPTLRYRAKSANAL